MIHVAPCSCELHQALREALERNAELEAELAENRKHHGWRQRAYDAEARAEKAEARAANLKKDLDDWRAAAGLRKARVAELEKERHELRLAVFDTETLRVKEREAN